ncbi:hypothetical protein PFISCL1PPCAC_4863, partial [Pristionchus fissidentatus]
IVMSRSLLFLFFLIILIINSDARITKRDIDIAHTRCGTRLLEDAAPLRRNIDRNETLCKTINHGISWFGGAPDSINDMTSYCCALACSDRQIMVFY